MKIKNFTGFHNKIYYPGALHHSNLLADPSMVFQTGSRMCVYLTKLKFSGYHGRYFNQNSLQAFMFFGIFSVIFIYLDS